MDGLLKCVTGMSTQSRELSKLANSLKTANFFAIALL
jgi:hypothetical protein